jgi:hypothetical protein
MYGQKGVPKRVKNHPWNPKSPTKQANSKTREGQKRVKNGPQKRHQKCTQKIQLKIDQKSAQNRGPIQIFPTPAFTETGSSETRT